MSRCTADGLGAAASFLGGFGGTTVDADGSVYITDSPDVAGSFMRKISQAVGVNPRGFRNDRVRRLLGPAARFDGAQEIVLDSSNNLYVADFKTTWSERSLQPGWFQPSQALSSTAPKRNWNGCLIFAAAKVGD